MFVKEALGRREDAFAPVVVDAIESPRHQRQPRVGGEEIAAGPDGVWSRGLSHTLKQGPRTLQYMAQNHLPGGVDLAASVRRHDGVGVPLVRPALELGAVLGIPEEYASIALIPIAYTRGTDFRPAPRKSLDGVLHIDEW